MKAGSGTVQDIRRSVHVHSALNEVVQGAVVGHFHEPGEDHGHEYHH